MHHRTLFVHKLLLCGCVLLVSVFSSLALAATDVRLTGSWSYQYSSSAVVLTAGKITNYASGGNSGTLRLELWAFDTPYNGGAQPGYRLATYQMSTLNGASSLSNVASGSVSASYPPNGSWNISLLLSEYSGTTWYTVDFSRSTKGHTMVCSGSVCSIAIAPPSVIISGNRNNYAINKDDTLKLSAKIDAMDAAGKLADIFISVSLNNSAPYYLNSNLEWTSNPVAAVTRIPLSDAVAPEFYNLPAKILPSGNYTFEIKLTESEPNPGALSASIAVGTNTIVFSDIPVVVFEPPPVLQGWQVGVSNRFDFSAIGNAALFGGNPPYHFQLPTFAGFPPIGIILAPNGVLSGIPKTAGLSVPFTVCAVDLSGNVSVNNTRRQTCSSVRLNVAAAAATPSPTPTPSPSTTYSFANWTCGSSSQCASLMGGATGSTGPFCAVSDCNAWGNKFIPAGYSCSTTAGSGLQRISAGANGQCNVSGVDF